MSENYNDPRWQKLRLEVMSRDGFKCVACDCDTKTLHVHHKRYRGELWESPADDLQTLCEDCHTALGKHPKGGVWWEKRRFQKRFVATGDLNGDCHGKIMFVAHCPMCRCIAFDGTTTPKAVVCRSCGWKNPDVSSLHTTDKAVRHDRHPFVCGIAVKSFYLAGKITGQDWREEIIAGWSEQNESPCGRYIPNTLHEDWGLVDVQIPTIDKHSLTYTGPWWCQDDGGGHGWASGTIGPHASKFTYCPDRQHETVALRYSSVTREIIAKNVVTALYDADLVFAWIDSLDCYGTLWELGYARGRGKAVVVAVNDKLAGDLRELWLPLQLAHVVIESPTAGEAWLSLWQKVLPAIRNWDFVHTLPKVGHWGSPDTLPLHIGADGKLVGLVDALGEFETRTEIAKPGTSRETGIGENARN